MRSIQRRFKGIEKKNRLASSYICFSQTVRDQKFNKQTISKWFTNLVDKNDYHKSEKLPLLRYLWKLSNCIEEA